MPSQNHRIFEYFMSLSTNSVYNIKNDTRRISFILDQSRTKIKCGLYHNEKFQLPSDAHPIDAIGTHSFLISQSNYFQPTKPQITRTFDEYIQSLNEYDKTMIQQTNILNLENLIETITNEKE